MTLDNPVIVLPVVRVERLDPRDVEITILRALLREAQRKLECYYDQSKGIYPGGPLYGDLMRKIETALANGEEDKCPLCGRPAPYNCTGCDDGETSKESK